MASQVARTASGGTGGVEEMLSAVSKAESTPGPPQDASPSAAPETTGAPGSAAAPESAGAPETAAAPETAQRAIMEFVREKAGVDFSGKYRSDEEFAKGVANMNKLLGQRQAEADVVRIARENPRVFLKALLAANPDLEAEFAPKPPQPKQDDPPTDFDPAWAKALKFTDEAPEEIKRQVTAYLQTKQAAQNPVVRELQGQIARLSQTVEALTKQNGSSVTEEVRAILAQRDAIQAGQEWVAKEADWLFQKGPDGKPLWDKPSADGLLFKQYAMELMAERPDIPQDTIVELAKLKVDAQKLRQPAPPKPNAKVAVNSPRPAAKPTPDIPEWDDDSDFSGNLAKRLKAAGIDMKSPENENLFSLVNWH